MFVLHFVSVYNSWVMRELEVNFPGKEFHDALFQAVPVPILVVDKELELWEYNTAAARSIGEPRKDNQRRLLGEALKCVHAHETAKGCGHEGRCTDCTLYWAVRAAADGQRVSRQWARVDVEQQGKRAKLNLQVSSTPFVFGQYSLVLLMLEGLED